MNKFITILMLSMLSLIWPLSIVVQASSSCCGGNRSFGGNVQPFEIPAVNEIVLVDGFTLKVNRVKWSIQTLSAAGASTPVVAVLADNNTMIRVLRLPKLTSPATLQDIVSTDIPSFSTNTRIENIRTTHAVRGIKVSYGGQPSFLNQNTQLIRYYFQEESGRILCFEVVPTKRFTDLSEANDLILKTLEYRRSV